MLLPMSLKPALKPALRPAIIYKQLLYFSNLSTTGKLSLISLFCLSSVASLQGVDVTKGTHSEDKLIKEKQAELFTLPSIDTSGLEPRIKRFLDKYYQENFPDEAEIQATHSLQFIGTYTINNQSEGQIKIIKKRPNKYKSRIKNKQGSEQVTTFNGTELYSGIRSKKGDLFDWEILDVNKPENSWIQFDQHFDSLMLSPKDPNKKMILLKAYREDGIIIQPIRIEHNSGYTITNYVDVSDNLILFSKVELHTPSHPNYNQFEIHYEAYEMINGIRFPTILISKVSPELTVRNEFTEIKINLGVSSFIFEPSDY